MDSLPLCKPVRRQNKKFNNENDHSCMLAVARKNTGRLSTNRTFSIWAHTNPNHICTVSLFSNVHFFLDNNEFWFALDNYMEQKSLGMLKWLRIMHWNINAKLSKRSTPNICIYLMKYWGKNRDIRIYSLATLALLKNTLETPMHSHRLSTGKRRQGHRWIAHERLYNIVSQFGTSIDLNA